MTFEETKKLLRDMRFAKIRAKNLRRDLEEIQSDIAALTLQSSLGRSSVGHSTDVHSSVESACLRLEKKRERLAAEIDKIFKMEDMICDAIQTLTAVEQEIIIGTYMRQKSDIQLARELFYNQDYIRQLKAKAIHRLSGGKK
ncbi:MAG: hypothetical protein IJ981_03195 [Clostridia bacterium]|nr:hypothetical protein [Clostridia bacterium]